MTSRRTQLVAGCLIVLVLSLIGLSLKSNRADLIIPRFGHNATLLKDGRIFVSGGNTITNDNATFQYLQFLRSIPWVGTWIPLYSPTIIWTEHGEILDTKTWRWRLCPSGNDRAGSALLLKDGRVFEQMDDTWRGVPRLPKIFDPVTETWSAPPTLAAAKLRNGSPRVVLIGHSDEVFFSACPVCVEPETGCCETIRTPGNPNPYPAWTVQLTDQTFLVSADGTSCMIYNPATETWKPTVALAHVHAEGRALMLPSGRVLVCGGWDRGVFESSAELYDPKTGTWSLTGSMHFPRNFPTLTLLSNGTVRRRRWAESRACASQLRDL